jgi:hypothetical protein
MSSMTDFAKAHAELDALNEEAAAERNAARQGIPCWLCSERLAQCQRPDCPRVWRLKDPIPLSVEGKVKQ